MRLLTFVALITLVGAGITTAYVMYRQTNTGDATLHGSPTPVPTNISSAERGKETVFAGLQEGRGTLDLRGGVVVTATGVPLAVDDIKFTVATSADSEPVPVNPTGTTNRTVIAYRDDDTVDNDVTYTVTNIVGDSDTLLEPGELMLITIDVNGGGITPAPALAPNQQFTFDIQTPGGATMIITRRLPSELEAVMQLH